MSRSRESRFSLQGIARGFILSSLALALFVIGCVAVAGQGSPPKSKSQRSGPPNMPAGIPCMKCHADANAQAQFAAMHAQTPISSAHESLECQDCHTAVEAFPHTSPMLSDKPSCGSCHEENDTAYHASSHSKPDKVKGDHPTCLTCHGNGNAHAVRPMKEQSRAEIALLCISCHEQKDRMARYGVDTDAVASYNESFHGKAVLKFGNMKAAICIDCHGVHDVLPPDNPKAHINRANAAKLCSKPACHPGANVKFAMSGANHLRLMVKRGPVLHSVDLFFRILAGSVIVFLTGGVALDIRKKVFAKKPPRSGRVVALVTTVSFFGMVAGLACATLNQSLAATCCFAVSIVVLIIGYLIYFAARAEYAMLAKPLLPDGPTKPSNQYSRFDKLQRAQHIVMIASFILLVLTGFPLRFAQVDLLHSPWVFIGGLPGARLIHRIGAVGLTVVWLWHLVDLLIRWKRSGFKMSSWTMLPNKKDVHDFWITALTYVGLSNAEPHHDRYQFRQKMGYFAVYWGAPIMILTGFVLWFPIFWGNRLPEQGVAVALVAHGEEATLALCAIIMWHLYDTHINPDNFPMSKVWLTGTLTQEEMEREHPVELERRQADGNPPV